MLMVISPAKTLDFESPASTERYSQADLLVQSQQLIDQLRMLTPAEISELMHISEKLGELNYQRFLNWRLPFTQTNAKQAVLAFKGDVYTGLAAETFHDDDYNFAQEHLRILSGLYGVLRPLDLIQAYRLEMGTRFENSHGSNLYRFWGAQLTEALNAQLRTIKASVLLNLASNEYFKAVKTSELNADIITPVFKDYKNGKYKIISFYAKKARGLMAAYIIRHQLQDVEAIKAFDSDGYAYDGQLSTAREWVFTRKQLE